MSLFNFSNRDREIALCRGEISNLMVEIADLKRSIKGIIQDVETLEIKNLEAKKLYHRKLKKELGEDKSEEDEGEKSLNNPVILPYDGNFHSNR